ncbi:chorismate synthase [Virgibacillus natechei]|uniref:Chorismate synthase n=1 Tax=Virgibacillus natechei TaxID=1216297 RepID=A0ABS4IDL9_9BACI|nr:hypothetical protein [Virgibacillus natechei]MBP1969042.1 chorismate synthase [Virgibacillus natechei]UZD14315.1 hypothetical protein OLD84_07360 [Virgibacillus natechei]
MENAKDNLRSIDFKNDNLSTVSYSGNSDVDVTVDTTPIAYAMLCTLLASKQFSNNEFKAAVRKLEDLSRSGKSPSIREMNDLSQVKLNKGQLRRLS